MLAKKSLCLKIFVSFVLLLGLFCHTQVALASTVTQTFYGVTITITVEPDPAPVGAEISATIKAENDSKVEVDLSDLKIIPPPGVKFASTPALPSKIKPGETVEVKDIKSESTGFVQADEVEINGEVIKVRIGADAGIFEAGSTFSASTIKKNSAEYNTLYNKLTDKKDVKDVEFIKYSVTSPSGVEYTNLDKNISLSAQLPSNFEENSIKVGYVSDSIEQSFSEKYYTFNESRYLFWNTNRLGTYALISTSVSLPTSDSSVIPIVLYSLILLAAIILIIFFRKKLNMGVIALVICFVGGAVFTGYNILPTNQVADAISKVVTIVNPITIGDETKTIETNITINYDTAEFKNCLLENGKIRLYLKKKPYDDWSGSITFHNEDNPSKPDMVQTRSTADLKGSDFYFEFDIKNDLNLDGNTFYTAILQSSDGTYSTKQFVTNPDPAELDDIIQDGDILKVFLKEKLYTGWSGSLTFHNDDDASIPDIVKTRTYSDLKAGNYFEFNILSDLGLNDDTNYTAILQASDGTYSTKQFRTDIYLY